MIENMEPVMMRSGERLTGRIEYYDYGVVSIDLESRFEGNWTTLMNSVAGGRRSRTSSAALWKRLKTVSESGTGPRQSAYLMAL